MFRTMGQRSSVASVRRRDPSLQPASPRSVNLGVDVPLLLVIITLVIFGIVMVFSASYDFSLFIYDSPYFMFGRQLIYLVIGVALAVTASLVDYHVVRKLALPVMGFTVLMLVGVLIVNEVRNGAARTLLSGSVQPSELAKLVTIVYLAVWLYSKQERLTDISFGLVPLGMILGGLGGLIILQPDISAVLTIFILGGTMFFLAGGDLRQISILVIVTVVIGWVVVNFSPTGSNRLANYLAGLQNPGEASYHVQRSLEAFLKGGFFGVGIGRADTKLTGLPVPPTDSIFAVVGEELGLVGSVVLVGLYLVLLWRGLSIAQRAPDLLGSLLAAGLTLWIALEAFINMAVMVNLLPFAGNALPFISAGGSNLVISLASVGILLNISRKAEAEIVDRGRLFRAVIDLRWRDRRRRVSSPRRTAGGGGKP